MINLLPYDTKQDIRAARINVILVRYIIILGISAGFLVVACLVTYLFINNSFLTEKSAGTNNATSTNIQSQANTLKSNFATAKSILDQQISYSKVIAAIANALPTGAKLSFLSLDDGSFGTTTNLTVLATAANHENVLKTNFASSPYFSNYKLISTEASQDPTSKYPFVINISITINKVAT